MSLNLDTKENLLQELKKMLMTRNAVNLFSWSHLTSIYNVCPIEYMFPKKVCGMNIGFYAEG